MTVDLHPALTQPVMAVILERTYIHCGVIHDGVRALPQLTGISGDHPLQRIRKLIRDTPGSFTATNLEQLEDLAAQSRCRRHAHRCLHPSQGLDLPQAQPNKRMRH